MAASSNVEPTTKPVRCAIYTRKSTDEGLNQDFNSLDAQREAAEAYILSQRHAGWTLVPNEYSDGGYTGANIERPGVRQLLADIEAGKVDCVVVYKVDRLSRSLIDFARMMGLFEKHGVCFVSGVRRCSRLRRPALKLSEPRREPRSELLSSPKVMWLKLIC
jgi:site-specific DNA recombinase